MSIFMCLFFSFRAGSLWHRVEEGEKVSGGMGESRLNSRATNEIEFIVTGYELRTKEKPQHILLFIRSKSNLPPSPHQES